MSSKENADYLLSAATAAGIKNSKEQSNFMGQMQVECGGFWHVSENLHYSGERLLEIFPGRNGLHTIKQADAVAAGGPEAVANTVYGGEWGKKHLGNTEPGDGWRFHGRGYVQLTGRSAYDRIGKEIGQDLVHHPELAENREIAAKIAIQYWQDRVVSHHHQTDVAGACHDINGGENGLKERKAAVTAWSEKLTHGYVPGAAESVLTGHHTQAHDASAHPATGQRIDHTGNPDHALYVKVLAGVHEAEAERRITPGLHSERLAAALVVAAKHEGLTSIDTVALSDDGSRAFAVQGRLDSLLRQFAHVETAEAVNTPLATSSAAAAQVVHRQQTPTQQPLPVQAAPAPVMVL